MPGGDPPPSPDGLPAEDCPGETTVDDPVAGGLISVVPGLRGAVDWLGGCTPPETVGTDD